MNKRKTELMDAAFIALMSSCNAETVAANSDVNQLHRFGVDLHYNLEVIVDGYLEAEL